MYALIYTTLYRKLEHLQILVSAGESWNQPLAVIEGQLSFRGVENYTQIFYCNGSVTLTPIVQGPTILKT